MTVYYVGFEQLGSNTNDEFPLPDGCMFITEGEYNTIRAHYPSVGTVRVYDDNNDGTPDVWVLVGPNTINAWRKTDNTLYQDRPNDGKPAYLYENERIPDGYTELERPDSYHEWNGTAWVLADGALEKLIDAALSFERDKALDVDVDIALSGSRTIVLKNNERTKINISFKLSTLSADTSIESLAYECRNGWFDLSHGDYQEAILSLDMFTQSIFDKLRPVYEANHTSVEDAVNDFKARLEDV